MSDRALEIAILEKHARMAACPTCRAPIGVRCDTSYGSHSARFRATPPYDFYAELDRALEKQNG